MPPFTYLKVGVACYVLYDVVYKARNSNCSKVRKITLLLPVMDIAANK